MSRKQLAALAALGVVVPVVNTTSGRVVTHLTKLSVEAPAVKREAAAMYLDDARVLADEGAA